MGLHDFRHFGTIVQACTTSGQNCQPVAGACGAAGVLLGRGVAALAALSLGVSDEALGVAALRAPDTPQHGKNSLLL